MKKSMTQKQQALWDRLQAFPLDEPHARLSFTQRLARENNWTLAHARRVTEEYKKFLLLCCITPTQVSPSEAVDQAWHLHLTYTRSYWNDLCKVTLGKEIHHEPTKGGKHEAGKFHNLYAETLKHYEVTFGELPPAEVWPSPEEKSKGGHSQWINRAEHWVVRKPNWLQKGKKRVAMAASPLLLLASGGGALSLILFTLVMLIFLGISSAFSEPKKPGKWDRKTNLTNCGSGCATTWYYTDSTADHHTGADAPDGGDSGSSGDSGCSSGCSSGCGGGCGD
jgi:hypothetical protein